MSPPTFGDDLRDTLGALTSRWLLVIGCTLLGIFLAVAYIWITPPLYRATSEILIDPRAQSLVDREIIPSGLGSSSLGADTFLLDSQVEVLHSISVLGQVIERYSLTQDSEFASTGSNSLVELIKSAVKLVLRGPQADRVATSPFDRALKKLRQRMSIARKGNTYVIAVNVDSESPEKAATLANAITDIYSAETQGASRSKILEAEDVLTGRLKELREAVRVANEKVETFRSENGLLIAGGLTIAEQKLRDLNEQLTFARVSTSQARARADRVSRLGNDPTSALNAPDIVSSQLISDLRERFVAASAREAALKAQLMDQHPTVIGARDELRSIEGAIASEISRLAAQYRAELEIAEANENDIQRQMAALEGEAAETNVAAITLRDLEREANANQQLYNAFLTRAKDAGEQADLPNDTIRTISRAFPRTQPVWPSEFILLPLGAFLGLSLGLGLALLMHLLNGSPRPLVRRVHG